jgi:Protein of unknown function (DUF2877)
MLKERERKAPIAFFEATGEHPALQRGESLPTVTAALTARDAPGRDGVAPASALQAGSTTALSVSSVGYLVPREAFSCVVHSVFVNACNFTHDGALLTLVAPQAGNGPTTLVLRHPPKRDLRRLFEVGMQVRCRDGVLRSNHAQVQLGAARIWQPRVRRGLLPRHEVERRLLIAARHLAGFRCTRPSVIDGPAAHLVGSIADSCRALDEVRSASLVARLVGWGEGLTPAGDDFLVGLLAGLEALTVDAARRHFLDVFGLAIARLSHRTTDVAAHFLCLAAHGHYSEVLDCLRDALLCGHRCALMENALENALTRALEVGATSGADMVSGLLAGLTVWLPAEPNVAQT